MRSIFKVPTIAILHTLAKDLQTNRQRQCWPCPLPLPTLHCRPRSSLMRPRTYSGKDSGTWLPDSISWGHCFTSLLLSSFTFNNQFLSILPSKYLESVFFLLYSHYYTLIQGPIISCLDHYNCFPSVLSLSFLYKPSHPTHVSPNRLIKCKSGGVTPLLQWLFITFRIKSKILNIVYKALCDPALPTFPSLRERTTAY